MITSAPRVSLPQGRHHDRGARYRQLIELTKGLTPIRTAVVHPVDRCAPVGALDAADADLIVPTFVGPEAKIRAAAQAADVDLGPAGNMLVKQLGYLAQAEGAGIVVGARIPIILTSRADTVLARMASCAVALVAARRGPGSAP